MAFFLILMCHVIYLCSAIFPLKVICVSCLIKECSLRGMPEEKKLHLENFHGIVATIKTIGAGHYLTLKLNHTFIMV